MDDTRARRGLIAAGAGALWGMAGYAVLWGHTPLFPSRSFVVGPVGTAMLAPVRLVLWGIHGVERRFASAPFEFSQNDGWIGVLAAAAGAGIGLAGFVVVHALLRASHR